MKLTKLNNSGVAHYIVPAIVVIAVALGGTYYLVASHADPVAAGKTVAYAAKCDFTGFPKSIPFTTKKDSIKGKLAITNTGTKSFKLDAGFGQGDYKGGGEGDLGDYSIINAGTTHNVPVKQPFTSLDKSYVDTTIVFRALSLQTGNEPNFSCTDSIKITN